jgi:Holliday junction resolvase RusA-like endonuclease
MARVFTLPEMPPSVNEMYANVPGKGRVKSQRYRNWLSAARWTLKAQGARVQSGDKTLSIEIGPRNRRSDVSNRLKAVEDSLVGVAIEDDRFITRATIGWAPIEGVRITIEDAQ